ncbi:hypothetical protein [Paraburkholderia lycopersici]|uniref:Uncharacterized protein n=1 Tax=Paraburkholderia lycopersici TaxID=416944 RepID=A0A1G7BLN9_9BURK|nr:hypothetical protein [Paraburkholderia lycopersici]SDE27610.1 hypothetical protein SAMN05421548_1406 [Paraburkholderia lycopersici]
MSNEPPEGAPPRATDLPKPVGDAVPAPTEPGLDRPLPPKTQPEPPAEETNGGPGEPAQTPSEDESRPLGDALPTPREPGLDRPLPPKKAS